MIFARKVWKLLVAIKDGLVLLLMLLFFGALYAGLSSRPSPAQVREGALLLRLKGAVVEEPEQVDPLSALASRSMPVTQYRARDLVRAIRAAASDARIKGVAIDLTGFRGGGFVHLSEIGEALDQVRAAKKPVLVYGTVYDDDSVLLAAHASEVWIHPLGSAFVQGPGGQTPYLKGLIDRFKVNVHVYRVGTYKDYVEPFERTEMSGPAREARGAVLQAIYGQWQDNVRKARPAAKLELASAQLAQTIKAAGGDSARAATASGLVDRIGDRAAFGDRVAALVGKDDSDKTPGAFAHTSLRTWIAANPAPSGGKRIGVVTVAGEIVDGDAGPGTAGGDRIAELLESSQAADLAGLVIRVDSPGGSVMASERIRGAIERIKAKGVPVAVSMANLAASGGYWVSTPGTRIFAEPGTITGSIGIFAVIPSFERTLADYGVKSDGVRTTPLSGQPDVFGGFTPEVEAVLQANIEGGYQRFLGLVAKSRGKTPQQIDAVAQGRIWDGGTARQIGLVDQFGSLDDALNWVAGQAKLGQGAWSPLYLGQSDNRYASLLQKLFGRDDESEAPEGDAFAQLAARQQDRLLGTLASAERVVGGQGAQAYCLGCPPSAAAGRIAAQPGPLTRWLAGLLR
ncbi:signal peptide peptidase SppA [Novosphingobium aerophilum]|uniref:Signal peptide peptidase SppA n=1 Tax=Novosphingobium aerophilum TaxID=2839843 RepID=A0A7X1F629_9SPHN|nr:signal peptide peptidase SppA [Novosphingobium aerophilum]MBC2651045.1 signal peptide peptidase SppA [Novosphingobium aerophilum]